MSPIARALLPLLLLAAGGARAADAGSALPKASPFQPAGTAAAPSAASSESIEFTGVTTIGKRTDFTFKHKTSNKTSWIAKGETKDGITMLNYDAARDQAVVKIDGVQKVLTLRKGGASAGGGKNVAILPAGFNVPAPAPAIVPVAGAAASAEPMPAPVPAAPATPQTEQQKQETEARMLVSDLLEIGMAQRKAYEDAQRKAAEGGGTPAPASNETPPKQP
jgi:hypothetical protein